MLEGIRKLLCPFLVLGLVLSSCAASLKTELADPAHGTALPGGFTRLVSVDASIIQEMRYAEEHNFIGKPIHGYEAGSCILTVPAAQALALVQAELRAFSLSLKVYDCYRPQRAVDHFVAWAKDLQDTKTKQEFYPMVEKDRLFLDGYIAEKSGHSRGSTVDLTIVTLPVGQQAFYHDGQALIPCYAPAEERFKDNSLDFGTGFDCFDPLSHPENPSLGTQQKQRRLLLRSLMEKHGFKNYDKEWWHFTLKDEPFKDRYFDFVVN
ncbi:MAG: M15 family metallopeptidase [Oligoflexales bacterium]|nr:M15 family metallopeptidase [Oligoflexales bacterium]